MEVSQSRRLAEDEIVCALDYLSVPDALGALAEIAAQVLADNHIVAGHPSFDAYIKTYADTVAARTRRLYREKLEGAH